MDWNTPLAHDRIVITGGGSGIGRGVAREVARFGAKVYVLGRREDKLRETAELAAGLQGKVVPLPCDIRDAKSVAAAFAAVEKDGGVAPALVHCAGGGGRYAAARNLTSEDVREAVDSLLIGAFNVIQRWGIPLLDAGRPGVAIALTSAMAARGTPGIAHSSAAKAGVEAFIKSVAREWGPNGLRLNVVGPGFFPTERTRAMFEKGQAAGDAIVAQTALGRTGRLEEIVGPIMFLLSEAGGYMTGHVLVPDGGFKLTPPVIPSWRFKTNEKG